MLERISVNGLLLTFVVGVASRDLAYYYFLREHIGPLTFGLINVGCVFFASLIRIVVAGGRLLPRNRDLPGLLLLSLISSYIYTFYFVQSEITPGLFNVVDYSFTPILTLVLGAVVFGERINREALVAITLLSSGILFIFMEASEYSAYLLLALSYPLATACSDIVSKYYLGSNYYSRDHVLLFRFSIALVLLGMAQMLVGESASYKYLLVSIAISFLLVLLPMQCLMRALERGTLRGLALFELLIPVLTLSVSFAEIGRKFNFAILAACTLLVLFLLVHAIISTSREEGV